MAASIDQQFIEYIVKSVVGNPDAVSIKRTIDEKGVLLELTVDPEDLGRVIGKRGATAQSLRTLLRALGTKNDARYNLKIVDVGDPRPPRSDDSQKPAKKDEPEEDESSSEELDDSDSTAAEDQTVTEELDETTEDENTASENEEKDHSDLASRTRAELADLDDLDV